MNKFYIYILSNMKNGTLYIGSTSNLIQRIWQHKDKQLKRFSFKYNLDRLVYYEVFINRIDGINRERRLKAGHRKWKIQLIEEKNPEWKDLYVEICS